MLIGYSKGKALEIMRSPRKVLLEYTARHRVVNIRDSRVFKAVLRSLVNRKCNEAKSTKENRALPRQNQESNS